jgi:hypothetical protein
MTPRVHHIIDPGLGLPQVALSPDEQVRCLSYLLRRIPELVEVPPGVHFEVTPAQYLGGPYPAIGLHTDATADQEEDCWPLQMEITQKLEAYVQGLGLERLLELSSAEAISWREVLGPHVEGLRKVQDDWRR